MKIYRIIALFVFLCSCSDQPTSSLNEVKVFSYNECQFSFTLKTNSYSSGRYDSDCEFEEIARFNRIAKDTIYYTASAGKRKTSGQVYHNGKQTEIEIMF